VSTSSELDERPATGRRWAWLAVVFGIWIVGGLFALAYAYTSGLTSDSVATPYHLPLYTGVVTLAVFCLALAVREVRAGRNWRSAFPPGYGLLVTGAMLLFAWPIVEIGWREGVGIGRDEVDQFFAPSRVLLFTGCLLVAVAPLRAAKLGPTGVAGAWPPVMSAALVFMTLGAFGIQPAQRAWLEAPAPDLISHSEIWAMDADGSHQTRLIVPPDGYDVGNPAWSADGRQIAYSRNQTPARMGESPADTSIWVAAADGTGQRQLIAGTGWYWLPHWSPDGQWITFTIDAQHGPGSGAGVLPPPGAYGLPPPAGLPAAVTPSVDIWRVRVDGSGAPEQLSTDPAEDRAAVYSPDGRHLLFDSTRAEGHTALYVANADGSNARRVTYFGDDWGGTWSPDSTRIAFNANPSGGPYDIYVAGFESADVPTRLDDDPAGDAAPTWSPDGTRIAFESDRADGNSDIWSMAADGSDPVNLTATPGSAEGMTSGGQSWGPDGRILYQRAQDPRPGASALVRQNLGVTAMLLGALILALLVIVIVGLGAPFGAVALIMTVATIGVVAPNGEWRFVPAAIIGGLLVDIAIRLAPDSRKQLVGAVGAALVFVVGAGATVLATSVIGWAPALLIGVAMAAALLAGGAALLLGRPAASARDDGTL
jgi:Tol biopolymer transport system component